MLPGISGFHWTAGHVIFLGTFFSVLVTIVITVATASIRAGRDRRSRKIERLRWEGDFHDLPERDRVCRHELTGEFQHRTCKLKFDCRECETHAKLSAKCPPAAGERERMYHRGHACVTWAEDGTALVGLDDFGQQLVGVPDMLELPAEGSRVEVNGTAWQMRKAGAQVRVLSPVEGVVVETAGPESDWHLKVKLTDTTTTHLLRGAEVEPWIARETQKLQLLKGGAGFIPDGDHWDRVLAGMFLKS